MGRLNRTIVRKHVPMKHKLPRKPKNLAGLKKLGLAFLITAIAVFCYIKVQPHTQEARQERQLQTKSQQLQKTLNELEQQKNQGSKTEKQLQDTQKQLQDVQKQLQAKRNAAVAYAAELPYVAPTPVIGCGNDPLMAKIYQLESTCNSGAYNELGCRGLGQACPGSKLPCGDADWNCQDAWFKQYAIDTYGSEYNAYLFRLSHNYW